MIAAKTNLAASVMARLLNRAKRTGDDYQTILTGFCLERFLYRLGASDLKNRFVLKGAMLLRVWSNQPYRATRDLDLLRCGDGSLEAIRHDISLIAETPVSPDAVEFAGDQVSAEAIRAEDEYAGARVSLPCRCGTARLVLQIDIGIGDAVWPAPEACTYPSLLDFPAPELLACPRETVVAEKFEAMVVLGDRNSRIKDFFDLHFLALNFAFDRATLAKAVGKTFGRRHTPIPIEEPIAITAAYWDNPSRPAQVRAFARRAGLTVSESFAGELAPVLRRFLSPILDDLREGTRRKGTWQPGGPWR